MNQVGRFVLEDMGNEEICAYIAKYPYNGQLFSILMSDAPPEPYQPHSESIEGTWIDRMEDLAFHDGKDHQKNLQQIEGTNEIERKMLDVVFPTLQQLAPIPVPTSAPSDSARKTVEEYLFPQCVKLELVTKDGKLEVIPGHHMNVERARYVIPWSEMEKAGFPPGSVDEFPADQVILESRLTIHTRPWNVFDVTISGNAEKLGGKLVVPSDTQRPLVRELEIYGKLKALKLGPEIRIPEFKGLITSGNGVVGFIMAKIPARHPSLLPIVADSSTGERPAMALRQRWVAQIEHTVTTLHEHGIVWGDATPDNLLADPDDDIWLLGFGGGLTMPGWMDPSMMETKEGDLAAVAKMKEGLLDQRANGGNKAGTK